MLLHAARYGTVRCGASGVKCTGILCAVKLLAWVPHTAHKSGTTPERPPFNPPPPHMPPSHGALRLD
jgi:hypothetical protein